MELVNIFLAHPRRAGLGPMLSFFFVCNFRNFVAKEIYISGLSRNYLFTKQLSLEITAKST
jgi:hypothetical protein